MSQHDDHIPLAVCVLPSPPANAARTVLYPEYIHEILAHAGICYAEVAFNDLAVALPRLRVLVTIGETALSEELQQRLRAWVEDGGAWLAVAGVCGLPALFGVELEPPAYSSWGGGLGTLGEGFLAPLQSHPTVAHMQIPLHYFNGVPVRPHPDAHIIAGTLDAHHRPSARAAVVETTPGQGRCMLIAPDITGTVVHIQQGRAITRDRFPSPDGTAPCCDTVLKSDDGTVLDWLLDRQPVEGVPGLSAFLQPIADQWRELLLRAIFHLASSQDAPLPVLWLYPDNLPALGHISHDTDLNEPEKAPKLLAALKKAGIHSTWCTILPGYDPAIMKTIREAGHEFATHYDAVSEGRVWSEDAFDAQWRELIALFGGERPVTNKNHYLRWEGDTEFFEWCARRGIQLDQSKGPSKTGEAGFNFGACHPYFPVSPTGQVLDVLELPTLAQDLVVFAPVKWLDPVLEATVRHHGIMHLLFHPAHIDKPGVEDALLHAVAQGKQNGMEWWTAQRINTWERARRKVRWSGYVQSATGTKVTLTVGEPLSHATLLWLTGRNRGVRVNGADVKSFPVTRWGFSFSAAVADLDAAASTLEIRA